jgi:hypothetical protein
MFNDRSGLGLHNRLGLAVLQESERFEILCSRGLALQEAVVTAAQLRRGGYPYQPGKFEIEHKAMQYGRAQVYCIVFD